MGTLLELPGNVTNQPASNVNFWMRFVEEGDLIYSCFLLSMAGKPGAKLILLPRIPSSNCCSSLTETKKSECQILFHTHLCTHEGYKVQSIDCPIQWAGICASCHTIQHQSSAVLPPVSGSTSIVWSSSSSCCCCWSLSISSSCKKEISLALFPGLSTVYFWLHTVIQIRTKAWGIVFHEQCQCLRK